MLRNWPKTPADPRRCRRGGFLYLGALRELFVISFAITVVLTSIWQVSHALSMQLSSQTQTIEKRSEPILDVAIDQEQGMLVGLVWPGKVIDISLETGHCVSRGVSENVVSAATSATNSTTVLLAEWAEQSQIHHRVDIVRRDELVLSEEIIFPLPSTAYIFVSSDGQIALLLGSEGIVIGWDLGESNPVRWKFAIDKSSPECRLSPDGTRLFVSAANGKSYFCDARTGTGRVELAGLTSSIRSTAWTSDGQYFAVGHEQGGIHVFDAVRGTSIWQHQLHFEFARTLKFANNGTHLAVGGFDEVIRVWDLTQPSKSPLELKGQSGVTRCITFTQSDETLISGSLNGTIHEWSMTSGNLIRQLH